MMEDESYWESKLHHLMREEEAPLPINILMDDDLPLLSKFIATHRDQINLPTLKICELVCWRYTDLAHLLILLRDNSIIKIIDDNCPFVIEKIRKLRRDKFSGSWFDSLESIIVNNVQHDQAIWDKLELREQTLKRENYIACEKLEMFRFMHQKPDLTSEHVDMLHHQIKCLEQRIKELESEIANIMENKKITSQARNSLNFFYPI